MKCPRCGGSSDYTKKEWKYNVFDVKQALCNECGRKYMEYYKEGKYSHVIPRRK